MATLNEVRAEVYNYFISQWGATTPVAIDNDQEFEPVEGSPWVRISLRNRSSYQETLAPPGSRTFARGATFFVQIFVPINSGTAEADALAQSLLDWFEGYEGTNFWFVYARVYENGIDGSWFGITVEAGLEYYQRK